MSEKPHDPICTYSEGGDRCRNIWTVNFGRPLCHWHDQMLAGNFPRGPVPRILDPQNMPPLRHPRELERKPDPSRYGASVSRVAHPAVATVAEHMPAMPERQPEPPDEDLPPLDAYADLGYR
jgi:hypothetical protein